ncbi:uncharacterized protein BXZ73DRAFT_106321 [Epithele typhae]|uniref:uncharacterized protein n=1 Tax=Epithele typhae TaxID=378194 RepID=UPI002008B441|nr:uncharacterized protein BXZ73DRAFT_106321 [Epithele typhae]KAH9915193.1 hypothetical protein BXZ73DRAFT_106321 [Epithele typhae]
MLPKPPSPTSTSDRPGSPSRTSHDPSFTQSARLPSHGLTFYSPYGRAYESTRPPGYSPISGTPPGALPSLIEGQPAADRHFGDWSLGGDSSAFSASPMTPPSCQCGPLCTCPGCLEHNGSNADPSATCTNPATCLACFECNINSLASLATHTARTVYDSASMLNIDDWLRQVSSLPDIPTGALPPPSSMLPSPTNVSHPEFQFDTNMMDDFGMWGNLDNVPSVPSQAPRSDACRGRCDCQPGLCSCPAECCGCCQGCECTNCLYRGGAVHSFRSHGGGDCCGGRPGTAPSPSGPVAVPTTVVHAIGDSGRASSSSSRSSHLSRPPSALDPASDGAAGATGSAGVHACCVSLGNLRTDVAHSRSHSSPSSMAASPSPSSLGADHNQFRNGSSG